MSPSAVCKILPPETAAATRLSILRRLLGRIFGAFFADFFFDLASPFAREPRPQKTVKQISEKQDSRHPFIIKHRDSHNQDDEEESGNRFRRFPIDCLETGIFESAEHHEGKEKKERR